MPEQPAPLASSRAPFTAGHRLAPAELWDAVLTARAALRSERHRAQRHPDLFARAALFEALELYVTSLDERGHPVPYALRDELRLLRLTRGTHGW